MRKYARNPRKHPERQLAGLEGSIRQFGFTMPVLIDEDREIIAGEARLEAARRLGLTEVPVLVARGWSRAQIKACRLTDNRLAEHATWNIDFLAAEILEIMNVDEVPIEILGWGTAEIDIILDQAKDANVETADPADAAVEHCQVNSPAVRLSSGNQ